MRGPALTVGVVALVLALPSIAHAVDRYSLQGGCYALQDSSGAPVAGGEQIRLQATALRRYLFYRTDKTYLADTAAGPRAPAGRPSPAADFTVDTANGIDFTIAPQSNPKHTTGARFAPAQGC